MKSNDPLVGYYVTKGGLFLVAHMVSDGHPAQVGYYKEASGKLRGVLRYCNSKSIRLLGISNYMEIW